MRQPIIFIGMHRSGTSLLGRLLESLGLFTGTRQDANNEAVFFQQINVWLMKQCGARWDMPEATNYLWEDEENMIWVEDYVRSLLDCPKSAQFLGIRRYFSMGRITQLNIPWGWKDPRNTFTLPMWLRIFPEAKVVYIERHGVDVAQSLRVRSQEGFINTTRKYRRNRRIVCLRSKGGGFIGSPRCASLSRGFSLWLEYIEQATDMMLQLPSHRVLKLRYEEVLKDPVPHLRASASFCDLDISNQNLEAMTSEINDSRAYSYLNEPVLLDFARDHQIVLTDRGYK